MIYEKNSTISSSMLECDDGYDNKEFDGSTPEELYGNSLDSDEYDSSEYGNFFKDPKVMGTFSEFFNLNDKKTRRFLLSINEEDQNSVLLSLTSKLYDNIVSKVDDIDYGDIPNTKGDITKLPNYEKITNCIELVRGILKEYKQDEKYIDVVSEALSNVKMRKDLFERGFKFNTEFPQIMYNNAVLSIISGLSYIISTCIEFVKNPNSENFDITLDRVAYAKTKNNMQYNNLKKFNNICKNGDLDRAMEHIIEHRVKGLTEGAVLTAIPIIGVIIPIILNIIPILREMVFLFYYSRTRISDFFDVQADLLQINAYNLQNSSTELDQDQKEHIAAKQLKVVSFFRKISNTLSINMKKGETETSKEISNSNTTMKIDDIKEDLPDNIGSSIF